MYCMYLFLCIHDARSALGRRPRLLPSTLVVQDWRLKQPLCNDGTRYSADDWLVCVLCMYVCMFVCLF